MSDLIKISEKITFVKTQKIIVQSVVFVVVLIAMGCGKENALEHDMISSNLLKRGAIYPKLLIGEWDLIKFAYTADGKKIFDVVKIKSSYLDIPVAPTDAVCEVYDPKTGMFNFSEQWRLSCINGSMWLASISGNSIRFTLCGTTKRGLPYYPHEEQDIYWAFYNAKSFVIKGNELMIYFTGDEGDKDFTSIAGEKKINLLILKKR